MHCQDNIIPAYIHIETVIGGVYSDIKPCVCKFYVTQCPWMSLTSLLSEIMSLKHRLNLFHQRTGEWTARIYLVKTILTYFDNSQKVVYSRGLRVLIPRHVPWVGPVCFNELNGIRKHPILVTVSELQINSYSFPNGALNIKIWDEFQGFSHLLNNHTSVVHSLLFDIPLNIEVSIHDMWHIWYHLKYTIILLIKYALSIHMK